MTKKSYRLSPLSTNVKTCAHKADPPAATSTVDVLIKSDETASVSPTAPAVAEDTANGSDVVVITEQPEPPEEGQKADVAEVEECKTDRELPQGTEGVAAERDWHDALCDCGKDPKYCLLTAFCPCCMACAEYRRHGECCGTPLCLLMSILPLTVQYRAKQNIQGTMWKDCAASTFCYPCQLCRIHRDFSTQQNQVFPTSETSSETEIHRF